jgi:hypothetical protein
MFVIYTIFPIKSDFIGWINHYIVCYASMPQMARLFRLTMIRETKSIVKYHISIHINFQ